MWRLRGLLAAPAIIIIMFAILLPFFAVINYSFQTPYEEINEFVGLQHYREILHDQRWWQAFGRNIIFSALALMIEIPLGLGLAYMLYKPGKTNNVMSMIITMPVLLPWVTIGLMWRLMIRSTGPLTTFIREYLHIGFEPFINATHAFWTIVGMEVWHWTSLVFLVIAAGLAGMDKTPVLAAKTENATRWQIFRHIELPSLRFPIIFVALIRFMDSFKIYDEPVITTGGGPGLSTEFLSMYVKRIGLDQWLLGYAAAASMIYFFIVLIVCFVMLNVMTRGKGLL